jgi:O-antigen/teichoic acid export membrane protein
MSASREAAVVWSEDQPARTVALNLSARWVALGFELVLGLVMLPFNTRHLGAEEYGLWMLAASVVAYFPILDLGYASAMDRFVAHYRALRNTRAINEIASTLFFVFAAIGVIAFVCVVLVAWNLGHLFNVSDTQARVGRTVLVLLGLQFMIGLSFSPFGAVVNGFQRTFLNALVGTTIGLAVAAVNVAVLLAGGGLVALVAALTVTRMTGFIAYRRNAYRVFPLLLIRPTLFRLTRLREVTGFSVFMLVQNVANRLNYATDPMVIGVFMMTGPIAVWTVAQRLADMVLRLTNQLSDVLYPVVVDCDSAQRHDRLRDLLVQGTRFSLALSLPVAGALALLAEPLVLGWTGPRFAAAAVLVQLLALVVVARVGTATAGTVLRGAGGHRLLSLSNLAAAAVNLVLSIVLIRRYGLPGVAIATLIPVAIRGCAVLIPVACTRVGLGLGAFLGEAVWPATWPAVIALGLLALARNAVRPSLLECLVYGSLTGAVYALLFVGVAIGRRDRRRYLAKLRGIAGRPALRVA